jgi:hypothetical protein
VNLLPILTIVAMTVMLFGVPTYVAYQDIRSGRRDPGLPDDAGR